MCTWFLMAQAGRGFTAVDWARRPLLRCPQGETLFYPTVAAVHAAMRPVPQPRQGAACLALAA